MIARSAVALVVLSLTAACSDDETTAGSSVCDGSSVAYDSYAAGLAKAGAEEQVKITLLDAVPAPPARGNNRWEIQLTDMAGTPLGSADITRVKPFMPDHGHGTATVAQVAPIDADGKTSVEPIDFRMSGVWTVTFSVETGTASDEVVFAFCIDG